MTVVDAIETIKALNILAAFSLSGVVRLPQGLTFFLNWCEKNRNICKQGFIWIKSSSLNLFAAFMIVQTSSC